MKYEEEQFMITWRKHAKLGRMSLDVRIGQFNVPLAHRRSKTVVYLGYESEKREPEIEAFFKLQGWTIVEIASTVGPLEAVSQVKEHILQKQPRVNLWLRFKI